MKKGQRERAKGAHRVVAINGLQNSGTEGGVLEIKKQRKKTFKRRRRKKGSSIAYSDVLDVRIDGGHGILDSKKEKNVRSKESFFLSSKIVKKKEPCT